MSTQGQLQVLQMKDLQAGNFASQVELALNTPWTEEAVQCTGAEVAAEIILDNLTVLQ